MILCLLLLGAFAADAIDYRSQGVGVVGRLDAALDEEPIEAALTAAALRQLAAGDRLRVPYALHQLELLLALPGLRGRAITRAIAAEGGLAVLRSAQELPLSSGQQALLAALRANVEQRLDWSNASDAPTAQMTADEMSLRTTDLTWQSPGRGGWLSVPNQPDKELELRMQGCDYVAASLYDASGRRVSAVRVVNSFTASRLAVQGDAEGLRLQVVPADGCEAQVSVALIARTAAPSLPDDTTASRPALIDVGGTYRVRPDPGEVVHLAFPVEAGSLYRLRTRELEGATDTLLRVRLPGGEVHEDDDGGGGLASMVEFATLVGGTARAEVELLRSDRNSTYKLQLERTFRYSVGEPLSVASGPEMPASAWNGYVIPISDGAEGGHIVFEATPGGLYRIQTDLNIDILGPSGRRAFRLLRAEPPKHATVRPVQTFVSAERGPSKLVVHPSPDAQNDPYAFLHFDASPTLARVPRELRFGASADQPIRVAPAREEQFDGGLSDTLAPGATGWLTFEAVRDTAYAVYADANDPTDAVAVTIRPANARAAVVAEHAPGAPSASVHVEADPEVSSWLVAVRNESSVPARVIVGVIAEQAFDGFRVGDVVRIGRHDVYRGIDNWADAMGAYVGRNGAITELVGRDASGAWVVRLDVDGGEYVWRTRNMEHSRRR